MNSIEKYSRLAAAEKVLTESGADSSYIEHVHKERLDALDEIVEDGGPGSGHWGHLGIPGYKGGSLKGSGGKDFRKTLKSGNYWSSAKKKQKQIKAASNKVKKAKTPEAKKEASDKKAALIQKWQQKYNKMHTPNGVLRHQGVINPKTGKPYHAKAAAKKLGTAETKKVETKAKKVEAKKTPVVKPKPEKQQPQQNKYEGKINPLTNKPYLSNTEYKIGEAWKEYQDKIKDEKDPTKIGAAKKEFEDKVKEAGKPDNTEVVKVETPKAEAPKLTEFNGGKEMSWAEHLKLRDSMGQSGMSAGDYCGSPHSFSVCDWLREHKEENGHVFSSKNGQTWDSVASCEQTIKSMDSKMRETTHTFVGTRFVGKRGFGSMLKQAGISGISLKGNETKEQLQSIADKINDRLKKEEIKIHDKGYMSYSSDTKHNIYTGKQVRLVSSIAKGTKAYVSDYHHESEIVIHRDNDMELCRAEVVVAKDYHGNEFPQLILYNNLT